VATLFARHKVQNYEKWREAYNGFAPMQKQAGVIEEAVYQADGDPTDVTVTHEFASMSEAKAFASSAELRETMANAGVVGEPTIWFANKS
jgi:hypothetical protein